MATIASYPVLDFSGGVHRDKGFSEFRKNELLDGRNIELTDNGRIIARRGSQQFGQTLTGTIENSFVFVRNSAGAAPTVNFLVNNTASTSVISTLRASRLSTAITTTDTSIVMSGNPSGFPASGTVEIEGDLIAYTGNAGGTLSGVTGITSSHAAGAAIHTWITLTQSGTALVGTKGITYAVLNNICFMTSGVLNIKQFDGGTITDVSAEPSIILLTNYRDRLYGAGDASNALNGDPRRVSFSNRGDGTTWTTASDFFDVEDQTGEYITAFKVLHDKLGIFKTNSIYTYDEIELKQRVRSVGAFNQKVVQPMGANLITFCPEGIFETNLFSAKQIGEPVRQYWENFVPTYAGTQKRVCNNTFAWTFNDRYFLFIGNITDPTTTNNVVLEYNSSQKSWVVHTSGYTNFVHANEFKDFMFGDGYETFRPAVFAGDTGGKAWRLYENKYLDAQATPVVQGGDIYVDLRSDTATPIPVSFETPLYDLTYPELFKKFKRLRVYAESGQWNLEYHVENERGITDYRTLGSTSTTNQVLPFPSEAQGWRCGLRVSGVNTNATSVFNGFIFEDTEVLPRP